MFSNCPPSLCRRAQWIWLVCAHCTLALTPVHRSCSSDKKLCYWSRKIAVAHRKACFDFLQNPPVAIHTFCWQFKSRKISSNNNKRRTVTSFRNYVPRIKDSEKRRLVRSVCVSSSHRCFVYYCYLFFCFASSTSCGCVVVTVTISMIVHVNVCDEPINVCNARHLECLHVASS